MPPAPVSMMAPSARSGELSAQLMWVDATANANTVNTDEKVREIVERCKAAHVNGIVVDVKPLSGEVLYDSKYAPRMTEWRGVPYPRDFDVMASFLRHGREAGIPIYASANIFSEGHKSFNTGPAYRNKEWQATAYETVPYVTANGTDRFLIARINEPPAREEIAAFTPAYGSERPIQQDELVIAYDENDKVALKALGSSLAKEPIPIPRGGGLLVGRGAGREFLMQLMSVGETIRWIGEERFVRTEESRSDKYAVFVNNIRPDVRRRILNIIREIMQKYPVEGFFLDRMRYPNLHADFSEDSRRAFEKWLGRRVVNWPQEIVTFPARPGAEPVRGPLFNPWLEWRSGNIRSFLEEASKLIRTTRKGAKVGVYVGAWYSVYYDVGVNWGSPNFPDRYDWMSPTYRQTGYAPLLDLICAGTYFPTAWKSQAAQAGVLPHETVEGSSEEALAAVRDETALYGSLYLIQYRDNPEAFRQAIRASLAATGSVMIFDLVYVEEYGWWKILEEELVPNRVPPHRVPRFVESIREARHAADAATNALSRGKIITAPTERPPL